MKQLISLPIEDRSCGTHLESLKERGLGPPHPPFEHLLPGGEKGTVVPAPRGSGAAEVQPVALAPTRRGVG